MNIFDRILRKVLADRHSQKGYPMIKDPPPNWGNDSISEFISHAANGSFATFVHKEDEFSTLVRIDSIFHELTNITVESPEDHEYYPLIFVARTHSYFLAAVRLAVSGQIPETYNLLRGCLENALYGYYLLKVPDSQSIWEKRGESPEDRRNSINAFKVGTLKSELEKESSSLLTVFNTLYETCIDFGAHPNEAAVHVTLEFVKVGDNAQIRTSYLHSNPELISMAILATIRTGLWCLKVIKLMYPTRFDLLGLSDKLERLARDIGDLS